MVLHTVAADQRLGLQELVEDRKGVWLHGSGPAGIRTYPALRLLYLPLGPPRK